MTGFKLNENSNLRCELRMWASHDKEDWDCALPKMRVPICRHSASKPPVSSPDLLAASISAASKIEVATSALHSKQYFSFLPILVKIREGAYVCLRVVDLGKMKLKDAITTIFPLLLYVAFGIAC